jgi:hypothetical protein
MLRGQEMKVYLFEVFGADMIHHVCEDRVKSSELWASISTRWLYNKYILSMSTAIVKESDNEQTIVCHLCRHRQPLSAFWAHEDLEEAS